MDIIALKCLLTVLYTNNFTEAGEILHMSQSAVSKKIMAFERELNIRLLERTNKHYRLTTSGQRLMPQFMSILESYDHAMFILEDIKRENTMQNEVRLCCVPPFARYGEIKNIEDFMKRHPDTTIKIEEMETDRVFLTLMYGDCDLAFCPDINLDHNYFDTLVFRKECFMAAVSIRHSYSKKKIISVDKFKDQKLILHRPESMLNDPFIDACKKMGFEPNITLTTSRPEIAFEYLRSNDDYVYIGLGETLIQEKSPHHVSLPIKNPPTFNFVYAWKKASPKSAYTSLFLKELRPAKNTNS